MSLIIEIISGVLILLGTIFIFLSAVGLVKMPDLYMRTSVTTKAATLGLGLVLFGTAVFFGDISVYARTVLLIIFVFMTAPIGSHMIGRASFLDGVPLWKGTKVNDLEGRYMTKEKYLKSSDDDKPE